MNTVHRLGVKPNQPRRFTLAAARGDARRANEVTEAEQAAVILLRLRRQAGEITGADLDPVARRVTADGRDAGLTDSVYRLLLVLMQHPGRAFGRAELLDGGLEDSDALGTNGRQPHLASAHQADGGGRRGVQRQPARLWLSADQVA